MPGFFKSLAKKSLPPRIQGFLIKVRERIESMITGVPIVPPGTDWVGYESLIAFVEQNNLLCLDGDFAEIGTFLGGGQARQVLGAKTNFEETVHNRHV
jgi:hypothetical protein